MAVRPYKNKKGELVPGAWEINCCPQGRKGQQVRKVIFNTTEAKAKTIELSIRRQSAQVIPHDPKVNDVWPDFIKWYARDHAASTVTDLGYAALPLLAHFGQWHLSRLTLPLIEQYMDKRRTTKWRPKIKNPDPKKTYKPAKPISKSRINTELKYFGQFIGYCVDKKYMLKPPFDIPKFKRLPKRIPQLPTIDEIDLLLQHCNVDARLAALLYHDAGLRRSEGLNLTVEDCFLDEWTLRVIGKGDKERFVAIPTERLFLALEQRAKERGRGLLISNPITNGPYQDLRKAIEGAATRAGIRKNIYNHLFRHTYTSRSHDAGVPLPDLQEQLGHADISTTRGYITTTLGKRIERARKLDSYMTKEKTRLRNMEARKTKKDAKQNS